MKTQIASLALIIFAFGCNQQATQKASTDVVTNPATPESAAIVDTTAVEVESDGAVIAFEKMAHDFGTITSGELAEYNFKFTNVGKEDLLISNAQASCGCTVPEYPKNPIKPGQSGFIKVKFNSEYRVDAFEKFITITANTTPLETVLTIRGFINPKPSTNTTTADNHNH
jgi:hypothetical protein